MATTSNQKTLVLNALRKNPQGVSLNVLKNSYRIGNVYEVIRQLRLDGNLIYTNTNAEGKTSYRLSSTPTREMIAVLASARTDLFFGRAR